MAEGGGGDFELFSAPAAQEKSEVSDEQFREQMQQAQQQLAQLQQEEGQAKAYDYNLAAIIVAFLGQPGNTDLFLLISRAIGQNIPSELILAVIALIDEKATAEVYALLRGGKADAVGALTVRTQASFQALPPEHKQVIDQWIQNIHHVSVKKPQRILESIVVNYQASHYNPNAVRQVNPVLVQLAAFIVRRYLEKFAIQFQFEALQDFMQTVFVEIIKKLEGLIQGQKQLGA